MPLARCSQAGKSDDLPTLTSWNQLPVKLFVLNPKRADPNGYILQGLMRALRRQHRGELCLLEPADLGQLPLDPHGQVLLVYGGEELHHIPAERLQRPFSRRAVWFTEDPYELHRNRHHANLFHCVFTNDSGSVQAYPTARHLPLAADIDLLPDLPAIRPSRLAFFSGTAWPNRKHLLVQLLQAVGDPAQLDLHLVANPVVENTPRDAGLPTGLHFSQPIPISEFSLRAARSVCTLVIGRDFSGSGVRLFSRSPGPRLFEAGLTGSCQLVHAGEIADMPADLQEGEHYLRFQSLPDLLALLEEARQRPQRFLAIGEAMAARIRSHHTYDHRARVLLDALRYCPPEPIHFPAVPRPKRLLFLSHEQALPGFHHGGAGLCLKAILDAVPDDIQVRMLCRAGDDGRRFDLFDGHGARLGGFRCRHHVDEFSLHHPEFEAHFEQLLTDWQPNLVHVNHLIGFTPAVLPLARRAGARVVLTLHDYFVLCDSWNLLDAQQHFCAIDSFYDHRCVACMAARRPEVVAADPLQRRVVMAEALAHIHQLIVPSVAAETQLRRVFPHLPAAAVVEPAPSGLVSTLPPAQGDELVVLLPGNLAANKGYHDFRRILQQVDLLELPVRFRVLGRVDGWIRRQLAAHPRVELAGFYKPDDFAERAAGCDLALFLSPWPETYCITFDEWARAGRACFFVAIGALAEPHRHRDLHPASRSFEPHAVSALVAALIEAATPAGRAQLRRPSLPTQAPIQASGEHHFAEFAQRHWQLYAQVLERPLPTQPIPWQQRPHQRWVADAAPAGLTLPLRGRALWRARLRGLAYSLPGSHRLARLWRLWRGA